MLFRQGKRLKRTGVWEVENAVPPKGRGLNGFEFRKFNQTQNKRCSSKGRGLNELEFEKFNQTQRKRCPSKGRGLNGFQFEKFLG